MTDTPKQRGGKRDRAGRKPRPDRVPITVRVARGTAEKLRAWAEGPRKIGELLISSWTIGARGPNSSRHLVDLSGVRLAKKEGTGTQSRPLISSGSEKPMRQPSLRRSGSLPRIQRTPSAMPAKQPLQSDGRCLNPRGKGDHNSAQPPAPHRRATEQPCKSTHHGRRD